MPTVALERSEIPRFPPTASRTSGRVEWFSTNGSESAGTWESPMTTPVVSMKVTR